MLPFFNATFIYMYMYIYVYIYIYIYIYIYYCMIDNSSIAPTSNFHVYEDSAENDTAAMHTLNILNFSHASAVAADASFFHSTPGTGLMSANTRFSTVTPISAAGLKAYPPNTGLFIFTFINFFNFSSFSSFFFFHFFRCVCIFLLKQEDMGDVNQFYAKKNSFSFFPFSLSSLIPIPSHSSLLVLS